MDIHQLQIFANVAECKGFLAASKKMHLSQSTVSTHMSALEHDAHPAVRVPLPLPLCTL